MSLLCLLCVAAASDAGTPLLSMAVNEHAPLRRHKQKTARLLAMSEKQLLLAHLPALAYVSYCASSHSKTKREEPAPQKKAILLERFDLKHLDTHQHVCT
jgi:hypothetical protein